jgi:tetratricopeptide (TPR) repeat protein
MKTFISVSIVTATLSILTSNAGFLFAQSIDKYEKFRGGIPVSACDDTLNRSEPLERIGDYRVFKVGRIYKATFDGESAEVLIVSNDKTAIGGCRIFRTSKGVIHKIYIEFRKEFKNGRGRDLGWFLYYNGDPTKLLSPEIGNSVDFIDYKGIQHSYSYLRENVKNLETSQYSSTQSLSTKSGQKIADVSQVGTILDSVELMRLAKDLYNQGRIQEAFPLAKKSLTITENLLGSDHVGVAYVLNFLGVLYHTSGDHDKAEALYQRAIKIYQSANHANLQETRDNLAVLQRHPSRQSSFSYIFKSASSSNQIADGEYSVWQGYSGFFIEVKGDQYRHFYGDDLERGNISNWKPVSELQAVRDGVIYYKNQYLCSDKAPKLDEAPNPRRARQGFFCVSEGITFKRPTK